MRKEIIVNADDLESRVAILEDGQLAELLVEREARIVGSIYKARVVSVLPGMDAAFADVGLDKNVFLSTDDVGFVARDGVTSGGAPRSMSISERLKERQEVVVQIVRAPVASKGARATTRLALPGRYLVLLLYDGRQVGVSRKLEDRKERERLRKIGERIRPEGMGIIIRTEAEGRGKGELEADLKVLLDLRDRLMEKARQMKAPCLLHQDLTLTYQVIRDVFTDDVNSLLIDSKTAYDNAVELVKTIAPALRRRVKRYRGKQPIFDKHGIEGEIDRLLRRRVWLGVGGYISIDQAEAFTAIDINTGRYTGSKGLADTILRTNLEAAEEVARQLRLRDLGGIIVIDFIDMESARHRQRVLKAFGDALKRDRQKTKIMQLSSLGLVEMTRKRRGESLIGILTETCPQCAGLGRIRNKLTIALKIEREVRRLAAESSPEAVLVRAAPGVAAVLIGEGGQHAAALEVAAEIPVFVRADERLPAEEQEITPASLERIGQLVKMHAKDDEVVIGHIDPTDPASKEDVYGWSDGYRVQIAAPASGSEGKTIVLTEVGHSLARGHVKGVEPLAAEAEGGKHGTRRGSRRRGRSRRPSEAAVAPPAGDREEEAKPDETPAAPAKPTPAVPPKKSRSRRGGRRRRPSEAAVTPPAGDREEEPKPVETPAAPAEPTPAAPPKKSRSRRGGRRRRPSEAAVAPPAGDREEGAKPDEAPAAPAEPTPAVPPKKSRSRRGGRRRRSAAAQSPAPERSEARPPAEPAAEPIPEPRETPASEPPVVRRTGLLRRGSRQIIRARR